VIGLIKGLDNVKMHGTNVKKKKNKKNDGVGDNDDDDE